tara:strand:+ start:14 stop:505 length:492 start_codon:yes stop_codon:yes gene_type:complete
MIILIDNREYIFDNIEHKNDMVYQKSNFRFSSMLSNYKLKYTDFIELFKNSLDSYVNLSNNDNFYSTIEEYFNYFKITTNEIVKKNMVSKICYLLINNFNDTIDEKVLQMIEKHKPVNKDKYFIFLKIILKLTSINCIIEENQEIFDEEYFNLKDFILDYYSD